MWQTQELYGHIQYLTPLTHQGGKGGGGGEFQGVGGKDNFWNHRGGNYIYWLVQIPSVWFAGTEFANDDLIRQQTWRLSLKNSHQTRHILPCGSRVKQIKKPYFKLTFLFWRHIFSCDLPRQSRIAFVVALGAMLSPAWVVSMVWVGFFLQEVLQASCSTRHHQCCFRYETKLAALRHYPCSWCCCR